MESEWIFAQWFGFLRHHLMALRKYGNIYTAPIMSISPLGPWNPIIALHWGCCSQHRPDPMSWLVALGPENYNCIDSQPHPTCQQSIFSQDSSWFRDPRHPFWVVRLGFDVWYPFCACMQVVFSYILTWWYFSLYFCCSLVLHWWVYIQL